MEIVFYLIPLALVVLFLAVRMFFWAVGNKQFEDLEKEASRVIFEDKAGTKKDV